MAESIPLLKIEDLHVQIEDKEILRGVNLEVKRGEVHALMGPNGSGKSTLSYALMGHPRYEITSGNIRLNGEDLLDMGPDERSRKGMFLAFQYPMAIPGVSVVNFLRTALKSVRGQDVPIREFRKDLREQMAALQMSDQFISRYVNEGFSGGEKKRFEILQMAMLKPGIAVMDETDSGLDIDALRVVSDGVNRLRETNPEMGVLLITHYQRLLNYITPDQVHVLVNGRIVRSGGKELALELEAEGYDQIIRDAQASDAAVVLPQEVTV
ncbi:MAG: Fe-S cluster assembly ATPase SufC [Armatimonadetes bacterium]|nr:Fe-S cluster assembly ATPase SufC [Armatimonadota bacterium]